MSHSMMPVLNSHALDFDQAFDESNPRSLINIVPSYVQNAMRSIPKNMLEMDLDELEKVKAVKSKLEKLEMLRTSFWLEYNRAQKAKTPMLMSSVYSGLVLKGDFSKYYVTNSFIMLYLITPPKDYTVVQHMLLQKSMDMELKILTMNYMKPVYDKEGKAIGEEIDTKLLTVQQKIADQMRNRLLGMPIHRSMQVNQNINHDGGSIGDGPNINEMSDAELENFVAAMKKKHGVDEDSEKVTVDIKAKVDSVD